MEDGEISETTVYAMVMPNAFKLKLLSKCMDMPFTHKCSGFQRLKSL